VAAGGVMGFGGVGFGAAKSLTVFLHSSARKRRALVLNTVTGLEPAVLRG